MELRRAITPVLAVAAIAAPAAVAETAQGQEREVANSAECFNNAFNDDAGRLPVAIGRASIVGSENQRLRVKVGSYDQSDLTDDDGVRCDTIGKITRTFDNTLVLNGSRSIDKAPQIKKLGDFTRQLSYTGVPKCKGNSTQNFSQRTKLTVRIGEKVKSKTERFSLLARKCVTRTVSVK